MVKKEEKEQAIEQEPETVEIEQEPETVEVAPKRRGPRSEAEIISGLVADLSVNQRGLADQLRRFLLGIDPEKYHYLKKDN